MMIFFSRNWEVKIIKEILIHIIIIWENVSAARILDNTSGSMIGSFYFFQVTQSHKNFNICLKQPHNKFSAVMGHFSSGQHNKIHF